MVGEWVSAVNYNCPKLTRSNCVLSIKIGESAGVVYSVVLRSYQSVIKDGST